MKTPTSTSGSSQSAQASALTGGQKRTVPSSVELGVSIKLVMMKKGVRERTLSSAITRPVEIGVEVS